MIETEDDLRQFFDTDDFAVRARVTGPNDFEIELDVIVDDVTQEIEIYGDTNITAPDVSFIAPDLDVANLKRRMSVTFPGATADDPNHARLVGKTFSIERIAKADSGTSRVSLKEQ